MTRLLALLADYWLLVALGAVVLVAVAYLAVTLRRIRRSQRIVVGYGWLDSEWGDAQIALLVDRPWTHAFPPLTALGAIVALALLCTAFGYVLYFRLIDSSGATNALLVTLLVPPVAILLGALFLGESLAVQDFFGLGLIALGLAAIDGRLLALDAEIHVKGPKGWRGAKAADFFQGLFTVDLAPDEIIGGVQFAPVKSVAYAKLHQRASHFAIVGVAAAHDPRVTLRYFPVAGGVF